MVLEALPHERPLRDVRGAELVDGSDLGDTGAILILLVALEADLDLHVGHLLELPEILLPFWGEVGKSEAHGLHLLPLPATMDGYDDRPAELEILDAVNSQAEFGIRCEVGGLIGSKADAAAAL